MKYVDVLLRDQPLPGDIREQLPDDYLKLTELAPCKHVK